MCEADENLECFLFASLNSLFAGFASSNTKCLLYAGHKNFAIMRKHFKAYVAGFPGAKELRAKLDKVTSAEELREILENFHYVGKDFEHSEDE